MGQDGIVMTYSTGSSNALSFGMGAVLLQRSETQWKLVAFASRSMLDTEHRYAQVEKEALACMWVCKKFPVTF